MSDVRTRWYVQAVAVTVTLSLLAGTVVPLGRAAQPVASSYADWVRSQLREAPSEEIEDALAAAVAERPQSWSAFLTSFVQAYSSRVAASDLAEAFGQAGGSVEALMGYLQGRFSCAAGPATLPRLVAGIASLSATPGADRTAVSQAVAADLRTVHRCTTPVVLEGWNVPFVLSLRVLFAAQPLGP